MKSSTYIDWFNGLPSPEFAYRVWIDKVPGNGLQKEMYDYLDRTVGKMSEDWDDWVPGSNTGYAIVLILKQEKHAKMISLWLDMKGLANTYEPAKSTTWSTSK